MRVKTISILAILILWICVIFLFSGEPAKVSSEKSKYMVQSINNVIAEIEISSDNASLISEVKANITENIIRKSAHFLEYFILGGLLILVFSDIVNKSISMAWLCGTVIAFIDEGIQIFSPGRGPQLSDVMLDSSGILIGILLTFFFAAKLKSDRKSRHID